MFSELNNIDISSCSRLELIALIGQILPIVEIHNKAVKQLLKISDNQPLDCLSQNYIEPETIAIANGKKLTQQESKNIDQEQFDVILDITNNSLRFRENPTRHTNLEKSALKNIGALKIKMISYLLEHPNRSLSINNIGIFYKTNADSISSNTLAKNINILRNALGGLGKNNPYIITVKPMESPVCCYKTNPKWSYLVIKEQKV